MKLNDNWAMVQPTRHFGKWTPSAAGTLRLWGGFALFFLWINLFSCSVQQMANNQTTIVEQDDHEGRLALAVGDTLIVRLPVQMGTGYTWQNIRRDSAHLAFIDEKVLDEGGGAQLGSAELQRFRYRVLAAKDSAVEFHYLRPWEKGVAPEKEYRIHVQSGR